MLKGGFTMDFTLFMVFSVIELVALFSLTLSFYRLKFTSYVRPLMVLNIICNLVSFFMRKEADLNAFAPLAILIILVLFLMAAVRIPAFWAIVVALTGYLGAALLQTGVMLLSFGFLSVSEINVYDWKGYLLQTITGILGFIIASFLYKKGYGFSFEFDKLGLKWATVILMPVVIAIAVAFGAALLFKSLYFAAGILFIGLIGLLYYGLRKEKIDADISI
jgi:hypothetical protein